MNEGYEIVPHDEGTNSLDDLFSDLPPLDPFDLKKEEVATQMTALMVHAGVTRTQIAEKLHWKKSQITRLLGGGSNPTIKTIYEFSNTLGYDVDLVFREFSANRAIQPWERNHRPVVSYVNATDAMPNLFSVVVKSQDEVASEINDGRGQQYYVTAISLNSGLMRPDLTMSAPQRVQSSTQDWTALPIAASRKDHQTPATSYILSHEHTNY